MVSQFSEVASYDPNRQGHSVIDLFNDRGGQLLRPIGYLPSFIDTLVERDFLRLQFLDGIWENEEVENESHT